MPTRTMSLPVAFTIAADARPSLVVSMRPIAVALTVAALLLTFLVSGQALMNLGYPYGGGGGLIFTIHPATYLATAALAAWVLADGGPGPFVARSWRETPGLLVFGIAIALLGFQVGAVQKTPLSAVIDNFLLPFALFVGITRLDDRLAARLALLLHAVYFLNSAIGYVEYTTSFRLTPLFLNGEAITYEWRATAIFGHPLTNALETATYLILLALGMGPFGPRMRAFLFLFHLGALVAFGGRTATVAGLGVLAMIGCWQLVGILLGRRFPLNAAIGVVAGLTLISISAVVLADSGAFDRFIGRFEEDHGSASTRVAMLSIFRELSLPEVIVAPDQGTIADTQRRLGLAIAIESYVVGFFAYYGALVSMLFFAGLACWYREFHRLLGWRAIVAIGFFMAVSATATGIASKSIELGMVGSALLLFLRPLPTGGTAPSASGPRRPC